jgi:hypothetical protein
MLVVVVGFVMVATVLPNFTVLLAGVVLKFKPVIVTDAPTAPLLGLKLVIEGATVKLVELVPVCPATVIEIGPVVAPDGTVVTILVEVLDVGVAAVPLNFTILLVAVVPSKFVPVMVTDVFVAPEAGLKLVTEGDTVKLVELVPV